MRRRYYVYPFALVVLVWAEFGIVRVNLPEHANPSISPKPNVVAASVPSTPASNALIAEARAGQVNP